MRSGRSTPCSPTPTPSAPVRSIWTPRQRVACAAADTLPTARGCEASCCSTRERSVGCRDVASPPKRLCADSMAVNIDGCRSHGLRWSMFPDAKYAPAGRANRCRVTRQWSWPRSSRRLADPVRLRLLSVVASHAGGEACVCDISGGDRGHSADDLPPPQSAARRRAADLERRASWVYYAVVPEALRNLSAVLARAPAMTSRRGDRGMTKATDGTPPASSRSSHCSTGSCRCGSASRWPPACCWGGSIPGLNTRWITFRSTASRCRSRWAC